MALALLAGELAVRALSARLLGLDHESMRFDPLLGWVQQQGLTATRINEAHERIDVEGDALGLRARPGSTRFDARTNLLVVGDSITAGTQVRFEDTWPAQLERLLAARRPGLQVVNAAVDGYDLCQEYRMAERLFGLFEPRLVVVAVYVGNDLLDYQSGAAARPPWQSSGPLVFLRETSYLLRFVTGAAARAGVRGPLKPGTSRPARDPVPLADWDPTRLPGLHGLDAAAQDRVRGQFASPELVPILRGGPEAQRRLRATERVLDGFLDLARARGSRALIVVFPTKQQVLPAQRAELLRLHALPPERIDAPQAALAAWAAARGALLLDVTPALGGASHPEELFWRLDLHLCPAGHATVAQALRPMVEAALGL